MTATLFFAACSVGFAADVEVAPPPRPVGPLVELSTVPNGYRVALSRRGVEQFRAVLERTDEKQAAALLRDRAKSLRAEPDPDAVAAGKLELIAFLAGSQIPALRTELREKAGPGGAVLTVTGVQAKELPIPENLPRLRRAAGALAGVMPLLPADARASLEALHAMSRTTPLTWKVDPRD